MHWTLDLVSTRVSSHCGEEFVELIASIVRSHHQACGFAKFVVIITCLLYFIHALCNWVTGQNQNCLAVTG